MKKKRNKNTTTATPVVAVVPTVKDGRRATVMFGGDVNLEQWKYNQWIAMEMGDKAEKMLKIQLYLEETSTYNN